MRDFVPPIRLDTRRQNADAEIQKYISLTDDRKDREIPDNFKVGKRRGDVVLGGHVFAGTAYKNSVRQNLK